MPGLEDPDCYIHDNKAYFELPARFAWTLSSWDGPMTAIAKYGGDLYYAKCHQSPETARDRYFWMYPLTSEDQIKEIRYQEWFREYIGLHCDYTRYGRRKPESWKEKWWEVTRPFKKKTHTYDSKRLELEIDRKEYTKRQPLGFFTLYSARKERVYG